MLFTLLVQVACKLQYITQQYLVYNCVTLFITAIIKFYRIVAGLQHDDVDHMMCHSVFAMIKVDGD